MSEYQSEDIFSATTRLSKAVTSTASALINNSSNPHALLKSAHYQKAIYDTLISPKKAPSSVIVRKRKKAPSEFLKLSFSKDEISYRAVTHIPDELLSSIPENSEKSYTLFDGFNAAIPQVDEELHLFKELNLEEYQFEDKKLLEDGKNQASFEKKLSNPLPIDVSVKKIRSSQSIRNLSIYKHKILKKMHHLEVKKDISWHEIQELDAKIKRLTNMRDALFEKVAKTEKDEMYLDGFIQEIDEKTALLSMGEEADAEDDSDDSFHSLEEEPEEFDHEFVNGEKSDSSSSEDYALIGGSEAEEQEHDDGPLMSQSIYTSLQKKPPKYHKISKNRKVKSTLQNYYSRDSVIASFQAHEEKITCLEFDYPFGTLVSASQDGTMRVWDLSSQRCLTFLEGHQLPVNTMQMDENLLVSGSEDTTLKLWDLSKIETPDYEDFENVGDQKSTDSDSSPCVYTFESHIDSVTALHFDTTSLVSGSSDRTIRQWDMETGHCLQTLDVLSVCNEVVSPIEPSFSKKDLFISSLQCYSAALASGTADGIVRLWDLRSGEVIRSLTGHTGPITALQFDERCLVTGSKDSSIKIWDLRMGRIQNNLVFDKPITSLQFDQSQVVFTNATNAVNIYRRDSGESSQLVCEEQAEIAGYKEGYLVAGYSSGVVKSWAF